MSKSVEPYINTIICGDCLEVMRDWPDNVIDTIITDPPYGLGFMGKEWDTFQDAKKSERKGEFYTTRNIGGQNVSHTKGWSAASAAGLYDHSRNAEFQQWFTIWATEALRIAKPGCIMLIFGGTRTVHRLACAIEDAGWQIRDKVCWIFGSGFPKSSNISLQFDKRACLEQLTEKLGRKPTKEELKKAWENFRTKTGEIKKHAQKGVAIAEERTVVGGGAFGESRTEELALPTTDLAKQWVGYGTALKPAYEDIVVCMKPLDGTFAQNAEKWGVAGLNIDGGRIGTETISQHGRSDSPNRAMSGRNYAEPAGRNWQGRWPANLILDEEAGVMLDEQSGVLTSGNLKGETLNADNQVYGKAGTTLHRKLMIRPGNSGGASRFFYCAKASRTERNMGCEGLKKKSHAERDGRKLCKNSKQRSDGSEIKETVHNNNHPTVKPLKLMEYLCKLTRPPTERPILLDPFTGSGTTLMAAINTDWDYIGIEKEPDYREIAEKRTAWAKKQKSGQLPLFEKGD